MKINFEKNGRKITVDGKDTPSEDDYLVIKGKYLDLTSDVSKTDFPNIKFLKNGINKYLKSKYLLGEMTLTIVHDYLETQFGKVEYYAAENIYPNNYGITGMTISNSDIMRLFSLDINNKRCTQIKLKFYDNKSNKTEFIMKYFGQNNNGGYTYISEEIDRPLNYFKNNLNKQLGLDIEFIN